MKQNRKIPTYNICPANVSLENSSLLNISSTALIFLSTFSSDESNSSYIDGMCRFFVDFLLLLEAIAPAIIKIIITVIIETNGELPPLL